MDGGGPAGVKDLEEETGGGPAGVVEGWAARLGYRLLSRCRERPVPGVEGRLEENGTVKPPDIVALQKAG